MRLFLYSIVVLGLAGCASAPSHELYPESDVLTPAEYTLGVSDQISVNIWKSPELSREVVVRPDGRISLPLVGDIAAEGFTAETLADEIAKKLLAYLKHPQVTVIVDSPVSDIYVRRVRVVGAVEQPLSVAYRDGMTVMDLVLEAGGVTPYASANKASLYRKSGDVVKEYSIRLDDILYKGKLDTNYPLRPSDIISIPERLF